MARNRAILASMRLPASNCERKGGIDTLNSTATRAITTRTSSRLKAGLAAEYASGSVGTPKNLAAIVAGQNRNLRWLRFTAYASGVCPTVNEPTVSSFARLHGAVAQWF